MVRISFLTCGVLLTLATIASAQQKAAASPSEAHPAP